MEFTHRKQRKDIHMIDPNRSRNLAGRGRRGCFLAVILLASLPATSARAQDFTVLYNFSLAAGTPGTAPKAPLIVGPNHTLYGTASTGGGGGGGVVFKVQTDGADFAPLWSFSGGSDGGSPQAGLLLSGGTLYGTAFNGGNSNAGTVFSINTDGSGFTTLYSFSGGDDGANPVAGLILAGNTLYGTASAGGSSGDGAVFALDTNGNVFSLLHTFSGSDGATPDGTLALSGSTLYGTTFGGGADGFGSIFEISTNGGGLSTLYSFTGGADCGNPYAGLLLEGSELYGTSTGISPSIADFGSIFSINTAGTDFSVLKTFLAPTEEAPYGDGANPYGGLIYAGGMLYGTAESGGTTASTDDTGTIFRLSVTGSDFSTLYDFKGGPDGETPIGGLVLSGSTLYGTASSGGTHGQGTLFEINTGGAGFAVLGSFTGGVAPANPFGQLVWSGGMLYGMTVSGGTLDWGTVFRLMPNGTLSTLVSFDTTNGDDPQAGLTLGGDGNLYGTTCGGGQYNYGTVFRMMTSGTLRTLASFNYYTNGADPQAGLTQGGDGNFYGTTHSGGSSDYGTVFKVTTNGSLTTLVSFAGTNGTYPYAGLTLGNDGNFYGTTFEGGSAFNGNFDSGFGTVFRITTNGNLTTLVSFAVTNGSYPQAALTLGSDGNFYGTTTEGGNILGFGTVFKVTTNGDLTTLVSFAGTNGSGPVAGLTLGSDGNFYGTTTGGGSSFDGYEGSGYGTVFRMTTSGTLTTLVSFDITNGEDPWTGLTLGGDGNLYGTTYYGGSGGDGTIFRLNIVPSFQAVTVTNGTLSLNWSTLAGLKYQVQYNSDLSSSNWTSLGSPATSIGATLSTTDSITNGPQRFYRVMISP
jgi:uncharacterized repeat protein (TIGR03803 family)